MTRFARAEGSKGSNKKEYEEATSWEAMKADLEAAKKKKKKDKKKSNDSEVNLDVTKTDLPKKSSKRVVNFDEESNGPVQKKQKEDLTENCVASTSSIPNSDEQEKKTKTKSKKKKENSMSMEQLKNNWVIEEGVKYKIFKDGKKKPWFDLAYEENEIMTRYNNFFVKREMVDELDHHKKSLEEDGLSTKEITKKMLHKERKFHDKLRIELLRNEIKEKTEPLEPKITQKPESKKHIKNAANNSNNKFNNKFQNNKEKNKFAFKFEENENMTQYEGYWILRNNLAHLQRVAELKWNRIIYDRINGSTDQHLTQKEQILYQRLMKKEKRREEKLLKTKLSNNDLPIPRSNPNNIKEAPQFRKEHHEEEPCVKFDGYYIRKDGAERLTKLRETMVGKGCTEDEIEYTIKNERRKEERLLKRENKLFCFKCRSSGHMVSSCPEADVEQGGAYDVCFKCGSAEHMARNCSVKTKDGASYPLATCFICNEMGHIARECPDNPKGLYPNGGSCNQCGSVEHLRQDCPELKNQFEEHILTLPKFSHGEELEKWEDDELVSQSMSKMKPKSKIITF